MSVEKNIIYSDIGPVTYRRNRRAKNISIRISRGGDVRVTIPGNSSFKLAERFVHKKKDWIRKKLLHIERTVNENRAWQAGDLIDLIGNQIRIEAGKEGEFSVIKESRDYVLQLPAEFDPANEEMAAALKDQVLAIGRAEAKQRLPVLCASLAFFHGLSYRKVTVRSMKSRWGSCSPENNISLNSSLIFLERRLVDYVILHELVHTIYKHHGPAFWDALERYLPGARELRKDLREQEIIS